MDQPFAVIDIGSHSIKLEFFKVDKSKIKKLQKYNDYLYLYQNVNKEGIISFDLADELIKILNKYKKKITKKNAHLIKIIATSVFRDATNSDEIINYIENKTNLKINIISGKEEAILSQKAFLSFNLPIKNSILFDLGGGSVEFSFFNNKQVLASHSFNIGVIRCEKDPDTKEWDNLATFLDSNLNKDKTFVCYGSGSSIRRFAKMLNEKKITNGYLIKKENILSFKNIYETYNQEYIESNYNLNGLSYFYLDTIIKLLILLYNKLNSDTLYYLSTSIRLGVVVDYLK